MNVIKKIGLVGVGPFKKPSVLTVVPGVTVLYGKNLLQDGNGNAVGKSLMASSIAEIFYDEPIIGTKEDKAKAGKRFVVFTSGKKTIKITSSFAGKEKLQVLVDGEDKSGRTNTLTREVLPSYWPITQEEFSTYGYIDASVPHPLARGSSTERKNFFNTFFQLDQMDAEKKVFLKEMQELKKVKAAYAELEKIFAEIKGDMLSKEQRIELEEKLGVYQARLDKLTAESEESTRISSLMTFKEFAKDMLDVINSTENAEDELLEARKTLAQAEETVDALADYKSYVRDMKAYREACEGLDMSRPIGELEAAYKKLAKTEARLEVLSEVEKPVPPKKVVKPDGDLADIEATIRKTRHAISHAKKFATGVCNECGQPVKRVDVKKLQATLEEATNSELAHVEYSVYSKKAKTYRELQAAYEEACTELAMLSDHLPGIQADADLYKKRSRLVKPTKVEKPTVTVDVSKANEAVRILEFTVTHKENIEALRALPQGSDKKVVDRRQLTSLQDRVYEVKTKLDLHNTVKSRATKIKTRLEELGNRLRHEEKLAVILEAYADKAMKKMAIEAISAQLVASINRYSSLVFDNYRFEFVWGTKIQLLVHRNGEPPTDVRKLSGAESMLFTIILVLSLLIFVPKNKRLSLLILDEPTASFSEGTTDLFNKLLPHVNQVIPSVLVITPKSSIRVSGARELTVLRDREGSKIVEGHPDAL